MWCGECVMDGQTHGLETEIVGLGWVQSKVKSVCVCVCAYEAEYLYILAYTSLDILRVNSIMAVSPNMLLKCYFGYMFDTQRIHTLYHTSQTPPPPRVWGPTEQRVASRAKCWEVANCAPNVVLVWRMMFTVHSVIATEVEHI